jgi:hypothetical protein
VQRRAVLGRGGRGSAYDHHNVDAHDDDVDRNDHDADLNSNGHCSATTYDHHHDEPYDDDYAAAAVPQL